VTTFDPYTVKGFKERLEACGNLAYLELRIVLVLTPSIPKSSSSKKERAIVLHCAFAHLQSLTLSGFTEVNQLILDTPKLKRLTLRSLSNLDSGEVRTQRLDSIELYACYKINNAAFHNMFMQRLSEEQKMPLIQFENTGMQRSYFQVVIREMLRYEGDMKSQIALVSQFTVRQWRALELIFTQECKGKEYSLAISKALDEVENFKVLYTHPDFCSAFAKALMAVIKMLSIVYPALERVDIRVEGSAKDVFEAALRLAYDKTVRLMVLYNNDYLYQPQVYQPQEIEVEESFIITESKLGLRG
jgi:hypothetical protein